VLKHISEFISYFIRSLLDAFCKINYFVCLLDGWLVGSFVCCLVAYLLARVLGQLMLPSLPFVFSQVTWDILGSDKCSHDYGKPNPCLPYQPTANFPATV